MNRHLSRRLAFTLLATTLAGCSALGPDRAPPVMAPPEHYPISTQPSDLPAAEGMAQHLDASAVPVAEWWKAYRSPSLDALIAEGLANNQDFAAAQHSLRAAHEALRSQLGSSLFPSVNAGFSPSRQRALGLPIFPQPTYIDNVFAAELQVSYTLSSAALLADRALAGQVRQQEWQLAAGRRALATNIVMAVIHAATLQEQMSATEAQVALAEQQADQVAQRYQLGSASRDDLLAAEQDTAQTAASLPELRAQALAVRHALAILLGRTPDQAPPALALDALTLPENVPLVVPSALIHQRPDILAAEAAVRATADEAGAATAAMFPSLTLTSSYGRGGFDWSTMTSPAGLIWSVGASLTQPLFNGGALLARKHQYEATHDAAIAQYKQTVLEAFKNVADTLAALEEDANTLKQSRRALDAARARADDAAIRYRLGAIPLAATLTARQQYEAARVQFLRARAARLADTAALFDSMPPL